MLKLIPTDRLEAVNQAIYTTFSVQTAELTLLAGGYSSSQTYKLQIQNKAFVVRVMGLDQTLPNREQQIRCLHLAATTNIAPFCHYADAKTGIIIMDYIAPQPYAVTKQWLQDMANTLRTLHGITSFPAHQLVSVFSYMDGLVAQLKTQPLSALLTDYLEKICTIKIRLTPQLLKTSCHNDLNPNNVLFDGQKIYLIDWEAAGWEDPFYDLATVCNQFIFQPALKTDFLRHYFGHTPTSAQLEKLQLMQHVSYAYYALHFLGFAANAGLVLTNEAALASTPDPLSWRAGYGAGTYALKSADDFLLYGMMQVKASLSQMAL